MAKTILEQIEDLQRENERLKDYEKMVDMMSKVEFGLSRNDIKKIIDKPVNSVSKFESKICKFFGLYTDADKANFVSAMCCDHGLNFFKKRLEGITVQTAEEPGENPE